MKSTQKIVLMDKESKRGEIILPANYYEINSKLMHNTEKFELTYLNSLGQQMVIKDEKTFQTALKCWSIKNEEDFIINVSDPLNHQYQDIGIPYTYSETPRLFINQDDDMRLSDSQDSTPIIESINPAPFPQQLFNIFFQSDELVPCGCKSQTHCQICNGKGKIQMTQDVKENLEEILLKKLQAMLPRLQLLYKKKFNIQINDLEDFIREVIKQNNQTIEIKDILQETNSNRMSGLEVKEMLLFHAKEQYNPSKPQSFQIKQEKRSNDTIARSQINDYHNPIMNQFQNQAIGVSGRQSQNVSGRQSQNVMLKSNRLNEKSSIMSQSSNKLPLSAKILEIEVPSYVESEKTVSYTLTIQNNGTQQWPESIRLQRTDDKMGFETRIPLLNPGQQVTKSIEFFSPAKEGKYIAKWRLFYRKEGEFESFGPPISVEFEIKINQKKMIENFINRASDWIVQPNRQALEDYVAEKLSLYPKLNEQKLIQMFNCELETDFENVQKRLSFEIIE